MCSAPGLVSCPYRCGWADRYSRRVPDGHAFGQRCLQGEDMNGVDRRGFLRAGLAGLLVAGKTRWASGQQGLSAERYKELLSRGLKEVFERIPSAARRRTAFTLNLFIAHEAWIEVMPKEALLKTIDAFADAGVDHVDMNPGQFPWVDRHQPTIAKYDAAVARIRERGLKLGLNPQYSTIKHQVASFDQWRTRAV